MNSAAPQHQGGQVLVRLGAGVEPIAVGGPLDVRSTKGFEGALGATAGADYRAVHIGGLIDESRTQADLLQGRNHRRITTAQRLRLQLVHAFAQLAEDLFKALQKRSPRAFIWALSFCFICCSATPKLPASSTIALENAASPASIQGRWKI